MCVCVWGGGDGVWYVCVCVGGDGSVVCVGVMQRWTCYVNVFVFQFLFHLQTVHLIVQQTLSQVQLLPL